MKDHLFMLSEKICCLITKNDFPKASLLAAIAKEEGAGFIEIQIPLSVERLDLAFIEKLTVKTLFSFDHREVLESDFQKKIPKIVSNLINYNPYAIEIDYDIEEEIRNECIEMIKKSKSKLVNAKYFQKKPPKKEIEQLVNQMENDQAEIYKLSIKINNLEEGIEALRIINNLPGKEFIFNLTGETSELFQIICPFLGSKFTYGHISTSSTAAKISINYLKKSLESLYENIK